MRVGATIFNQNYTDWIATRPKEPRRVRRRPPSAPTRGLHEELEIARIADATGFDAVWTIEHHFTPYTMVTKPAPVPDLHRGITKRVDLGTM